MGESPMGSMTRPGPLLKFSRNPLETGSDLLTYASLLEGSEPLSWEDIPAELPKPIGYERQFLPKKFNPNVSGKFGVSSGLEGEKTIQPQPGLAPELELKPVPEKKPNPVLPAWSQVLMKKFKPSEPKRKMYRLK